MSGDGGEEENVVKVEATNPASTTIDTSSTTAITDTPSATAPTPPPAEEPLGPLISSPLSAAPDHNTIASSIAASDATAVIVTSAGVVVTTTSPVTLASIVTATSTAPSLTATSSLTIASAVAASATTVSTSAAATTVVASSAVATETTTTVVSKVKDEDEEVEEEAHEIEEATSPERVHITPEQLASLSKEDLVERWVQQDKFVEHQQSRLEALEREVEELRGSRENEERLKGQLAELQRKEQYHIMRLASKEHELQDLVAQVQELKSMSAGIGGLKHCLLDPAVNLLFERLKRDLDSARTKMEETQNELSAWKFTPDSNTGKQLMAKCRLLIKENEELGRMITSGRLAKLEGDLALQRNFSEELKKSQSELDEFLLEMDEDTEGMQGTIYYLQQQLRQAKERIAQLNAQLSLTQTPDAQPPEEGSGLVCTEGGSDLICEAERTEEQTLVPQPNGDATHDDPEINSESLDLDATPAAPLTNGRKRTQSELEEGVELVEGGQDVADIVSEADDVTPSQKRTKIEGEDEVGGGEENNLTVLENGVMESE